MTIHSTPLRGGYSRAVVPRIPGGAGDWRSIFRGRTVTRAAAGHLVLFRGRVMVPGRLSALPGGLS